MILFKTKFVILAVATLSFFKVNSKLSSISNSLDRVIHNENYDIISDQGILRRKNYILCNMSDRTKNACFSDSFNFTFSAYFHDKNFARLDNLKNLAQTLGEYSTCEIKYMKYNKTAGTMDYFNEGEIFYWYQGKKLNETIRPEVFISKMNNIDNRKKITFICSLPKSDVELSIYGISKAFRPIHTHPTTNYKVTVSALHIRLNFMHLENINIYLSKYKSNENDDANNYSIQSQFATQNLIKRSAERYLIYYDDKCQKCVVNEPIYSPKNVNSLTCNLKADTCESNGKCFLNKEVDMHLLHDVHDEELIPRYNLFVCNTLYSQTSLYMPCMNDNGGCNFNETCMFDSRDLKVICQ